MLIVWFLQLFILNNIIFAQPPTCFRSSRYLVPQTSGDNGFRVAVEGGFKTYVPGRTYKISLSGFKNQFYQSSFKEFMLIAVPSTWSDEQPYCIRTDNSSSIVMNKKMNLNKNMLF
ncbi:unnamed protein product [Rotaria sp. Silwood2]|nr:unnamed protein product [Rotaria sp. Silwood2]